MLHVSALFDPSSGTHFKKYCFSLMSYSFLSYCIGDPFCITNHNYCLYVVRCPLLFVIGGRGFFPVGKSSDCSCLWLWKGLVSLRFLCGCLSPGSAVGQGLRPFVVYPPSCRGDRFYTQNCFKSFSPRGK